MTDKERITEILKAYTKKHNIMASSVILEEYAEELLANGVIVSPCIAMVEQFIDGSLKFDRKRTAHNGRMAVIYIDKKKHSSFPLIDITDQFYNIDTAEARIKALERSKDNA